MSDEDTLVLDPETFEKAEEKKKPVEDKEEDLDSIKDRSTAPPKKGPCIRCNGNLPINRLFLCYRCWVITNLEEDAKKRGDSWHDGDPHPDSCKCEGLGEHKSGSGSFHGNN